MKKFIYLLFLFPVLFACEKGAEITPDEGLEELDIGIDDSNDLEKEEAAFLLEGKSELATSRHDVPIIYEVLFEDTISTEEICVERYWGYGKYPYNKTQRLIIKGNHFEPDQEESTVEAIVGYADYKEYQSLNVVSWSDTEIAIDITNQNLEYKNVYLRFYVTVEHDGKTRVARKGVKCSGGIELSLIGLDGATSTITHYYPSTEWQSAFYQKSNGITANVRQAVSFSTSFVPEEGDIIMSSDLTKMAYITLSAPYNTRTGLPRFYMKFHTRNRNCFGRSSHRIYRGNDKKVYKKKDDLEWTLLYKAIP